MTPDRPLTPEQTFGAAILQQAWKDLRHPQLRVREEAAWFWSSPQALAYWDDLLGLEGTLVRRCHRGTSVTPQEDLCDTE